MRWVKPWSDEEQLLLMDMVESLTDEDIAHLLERTTAAIEQKRRELGRLRRAEDSRRWTISQERFLVENHRVLTNQQIADQLGRTKTSVRSKIKIMRLVDRADLPRVWTDAEEAFLLRAWQTDHMRDIARALGRTENAVRGRIIYKFKLRRSPAYLVGSDQAYRLDSPELRELVALNDELKKGLRDEERRRLAGNPVQGVGGHARQSE